MATVDDVRDRDFAGTFALFTDTQIETLLADALCYIGDTWSGCEDCYDLAWVYMAMHLGVTGAQGSAPGPMTSASAGGLSASWAAGTVQDGLSSTNWGRQVLALAAGCGRTGPFVMSSPAATCC